MQPRIGIWGLGIVGKAAVTYFTRKNCLVEIFDHRTLAQDEQEFIIAHGARLRTNLQDFLRNNDAILPSPGIDLRDYASYNHKWLSELDLFAQECTKPIIAITGSVGKTTTTTLLSALLNHSGIKIFTGGNIGKGLLDSIDEANNAAIVVLEVSSFQLENSKTFKATYAILTNLYPNHLDRHGSFETYRTIKLGLISRATHALIPLSLAPFIAADSTNTHYFCATLPSAIAHKKEYFPLYYLHNGSIRRRYQTQDVHIIDTNTLSPQLYSENSVILLSFMHMLNQLRPECLSHLNTLEPLDHRLEKINIAHATAFYNDSKATIPASTLAALEQFSERSVILFLGGISKGVNRQNFIASLFGKVKRVICFGKEAASLHQWCVTYGIPSHAFDTLDKTMPYLQHIIQDAEIVLFSPGGASYDLYAHYKERGDHFKQLIVHNFDKKGISDASNQTIKK